MTRSLLEGMENARAAGHDAALRLFNLQSARIRFETEMRVVLALSRQDISRMTYANAGYGGSGEIVCFANLSASLQDRRKRRPALTTFAGRTHG